MSDLITHDEAGNEFGKLTPKPNKPDTTRLETLKNVKYHLERGELTLETLNHWIESEEQL